MDRRLAVVAAAGAFAVLLVALSGNGSSPAPSLPAESTVQPQPASSIAAPATDPGTARNGDPVEVVLGYWDALTDGSGDVAALLDMPPDVVAREVGLAEYSAAFGGTYLATCREGVSVGDESIVDCDVEVVDEPLAAAFGIGSNPTQFRVRDGKISRVGYLKAYSTIDLALSVFALRTDEAGFGSACSDPPGRYMADAGVVYSGQCGRFLTELVAATVAELGISAPCGAECDAALLSAIRPSRD